MFCRNKQTPGDNFLIVLFTARNYIHSYKCFVFFSSGKTKYYDFKNLFFFKKPNTSVLNSPCIRRGNFFMETFA